MLWSLLAKWWPLSYRPKKCVVGRLQATDSNIQCRRILYNTRTVKNCHQAKVPWAADKRYAYFVSAWQCLATKCQCDLTTPAVFLVGNLGTSSVQFWSGTNQLSSLPCSKGSTWWPQISKRWHKDSCDMVVVIVGHRLLSRGNWKASSTTLQMPQLWWGLCWQVRWLSQNCICIVFVRVINKQLHIHTASKLIFRLTLVHEPTTCRNHWVLQWQDLME
jgi:hypothetical protein